jgi:hypothetical protein
MLLIRFAAGWLSTLILLFYCLVQAATLDVTIKDPSGAVIAGARVQLRDAQGAAVVDVKSDAAGRVILRDIKPGEYLVVIEQAGFEPEQRDVKTTGEEMQSLSVTLIIQKQETAIEVGAKRSAMANSDPNYLALRSGVLKTSFRVEKLTIQRDLGKLVFNSGTIDFFAPVLGNVVMGVFTGNGEFRLKPNLPPETANLKRLTGEVEIQEPFRSAVLCFTDGTYSEIAQAGHAIDAGQHGADALHEFRSRMRRRSDQPLSLVDALLGGEHVTNIEADLLADLYDPGAARSFAAYLHGTKHNDLRFLIKPRGVLPHLPSSEEVAVINFDPQGQQEGIWYFTHLDSEWKAGNASSMEDKRAISVEHYKVETTIGKNDHLAATCDMKIKALVSGSRVLRFALLPALRVTRVSQGPKEIPYVQEGRKEDGSFYVILPAPLEKGAGLQLTIEYEGNKVLTKAGGGTFYIEARSAWYPNVNAFTEQSTYDLTFKIPKRYTLVSVGQLVKEWKEDDYAASQWVSKVPLAVAGFNYGLFKLKKRTDDLAKYDIETYASSEVPDYLKGAQAIMPSAMAENAMIETQNALRCFEKFFGMLPYGRIAITQQPDFNFGQSWPSLVYLPVSAFLDSTQRWQLMGKSAFRFANFIEEVTPHEVSHQWWGHLVAWASYHDQWLSEGFADFSAGLYLQFTEKKLDRFNKYWERQRKSILDKNEHGLSANDAGPVWMGLRLDSFKSDHAYNRLVYAKGGYVLHMLRQLMFDAKTGDADFIAMMQDFVTTYTNRSASTESFKEIAEKHLPPGLDMEGNHRLDWFFRDWIYGTEIPKYKLEYSLTEQGGATLLKGSLTQSGVSDNFIMRVPVYLEFEGSQIVRLGAVGVAGSSTAKEFQVKLPKRPKRVFLNAFQDILASEAISKEI